MSIFALLKLQTKILKTKLNKNLLFNAQKFEM